MTAEAQQVQAAQTGQNDAFDTLYKAHHARIYNTVASRAHPDDVEDLVQITFMRAFEHLARFRNESAFSTWLTRIALNVCNTHWRQRQQQQSRHISLETTTLPHVNCETPETQLQRSEYQTLVKQNIDHLPEQYRTALWLHYIKERSYEDITHLMSVPIGTVKTWLNRGRIELKKRLHQQGIY